MTKDRLYRTLVASKRWARLAAETKTAAGWRCADCGRITHRLAVHHVIPVETGRTKEEMERLCFDTANLEVLCYDCHAARHRHTGMSAKDTAMERDRGRAERFVRMFTGKDGAENECKDFSVSKEEAKRGFPKFLPPSGKNAPPSLTPPVAEGGICVKL